MIAAEKFLFRIINIKEERAVNFSFSTSHFQFPISFLIPHSEEPITRSFHLPYLPSESTLSRIFLFLEAPPTGFFAGVSIIANQKKAVTLYCSTIPILQSPFYNPHSTILILQSPFYNPHSTIPILRSPFYNPHSTIPIPQSSFSYSCF